MWRFRLQFRSRVNGSYKNLPLRHLPAGGSNRRSGGVSDGDCNGKVMMEMEMEMEMAMAISSI